MYITEADVRIRWLPAVIGRHPRCFPPLSAATPDASPALQATFPLCRSSILPALPLRPTFSRRICFSQPSAPPPHRFRFELPATHLAPVPAANLLVAPSFRRRICFPRPSAPPPHRFRRSRRAFSRQLSQQTPRAYWLCLQKSPAGAGSRPKPASFEDGRSKNPRGPLEQRDGNGTRADQHPASPRHPASRRTLTTEH
jgi:hypothetical protein